MTRGSRLAVSVLIAGGCAPWSPGSGVATPPGPRGAQPGAPPGAGVAQNRVSLTLEQDFGLAYGKDVCGEEAQLSGGFACFRSNGTQYHGTPLRGDGDGDGADPAGAFPATTRLLAGFDRVVTDNWTFGLRAGLVLSGGGPRPDGAEAPEFLPLHGEARATYWLGASPLAGPGWRWGVFFNGGVAQVDAAWRVLVEEDTRRPPPASQPSNPSSQTLDAYKKAGTGFVGGGAAAACAFSRSSAFFLNLRLMQLFPSSGTVVAPEIGYEHGF